jgi:DNA polymerase-3 subunit gamma/tau
VAFAGRNLTYDVVAEHLHVLDHTTYFRTINHALQGEISEMLLIFDEILARGFDPHHFVTGMGEHLRNLMVTRDEATLKLMEGTDDVKAQYREQAGQCSLHFLVKALEHVNQADNQFRASNHQRLLVELLLMQLGSLEGGEKKK